MRLAVFAHYDHDGIIDDYVVYYLQAFRALCEHLIFVSDSRRASWGWPTR